MPRRSTTKSAGGAAAAASHKDNVQVVIRCRPQNAREKARKESVIVRCTPDEHEIAVRQARRNSRDDGLRRFTFDRVFGAQATQREVYDAVVAPVVREVMQGFNCTVFALSLIHI